MVGGIAAILALGTAQGVTAQAGDTETDVAMKNYAASLDSAFGPGYWVGRFEERDAGGTVTKVDETPSCFKQGESQALVSGITQALETLRSVANCTSTGGAANSLNMALSCKASDGRVFEYNSVGTYKPGKAVDLHISIGQPGKMNSMHINVAKASDSCPN